MAGVLLLVKTAEENREMTLEIPLIGMMVLTMIVWIYMYARRLSYIMRHRVNYEELRTIGALEERLPDAINYPAQNLRNLFELPVIFYALCFYLIWENQLAAFDIYAGYLFFFGRVAHSIIQCSYNRVSHRFGAYLISSLALWAMLIHAVLGWFFFI